MSTYSLFKSESKKTFSISLLKNVNNRFSSFTQLFNSIVAVLIILRKLGLGKISFSAF